ncbi:MAG TPA: ABC transporter permease [Gemmatimonadales bacterium]|jgi:predicted permease
MPNFRARIARRLRALFRAEAVDHELNDEIRLHVDLEADELVRTEGLPPDEARRRALASFGGVERYREEHRDARGVRWIEQRGQDIRYAVRGLRNRPGFAIGVIVTLALGIGANAAMFSIVDRLLFRAPPFMHDASRSHRVVLTSTFRGRINQGTSAPYARFVDLTQNTHSFERTALFVENSLAVGVGADAREMQVGVVTSGFFGFFDATPVLGRYFTAAEDAPPRGSPVAVLSYGMWQTQYGGRRDVVGQQVQIGSTLYTIIGVAPKHFAGLWPETPPAAFVPASVFAAEQWAGLGQHGDWSKTYALYWADMIVERKPGVTVAQASADLTQAFVQSYRIDLAARPRQPPVDIAKPHAIAASILSERGPTESSLAKVATWIGGVALIVWLIACANVANLLLARALQRRREIAVRLALGVTRGRLAGQLLTESLILAVLGGVSGVLLAQWGGAVLRTEFLSKTSTASVVNDPRALIFAGAAALLAGLLTGLAPLAQTRRMNLNRDLKEGAREGTYQRSGLRSALLVVQGMLSVVLLVGAGLFVRSLRHVRAVPLGYQPEHVLLVERNMRGVALDSASSVALIRSLDAKAGTIPGVEHVSRQLTMPFWNTSTATGIRVRGVDGIDSVPGSFDMNAVSPDYFATMGTRIIAGRGIGIQDAAGAPPVMVVNESMAKALWPHASAIGQCVLGGGNPPVCTTVVGVSEDIKDNSLSDHAGYYILRPAEQVQPDHGGLFVRVQGDPDAMLEPVRKALQAVMPGASYVTVTPIRDIIGDQTQAWELGASMFVIFGALALLLAAIGLYSVIAFNVGQRMHEIGVRVALGAGRRDIVGHVVTGGLKLAAAGVILGVAVSLGGSHWIEPLLFQESSHDPVIFGVVAAVLLVVAALASFIPARRAARVDPMRALRAE